LFAEFLHWYPGYTEESMMRMTARKFFLLQRYIKRIRARKNYEHWLLTNWNFLGPESKEYKEKYFSEMLKTAFPDAKGAKPYWDNPGPGLRQIK